MSNGGSISLRMSLKGAEQVRAELASLGPAGSRAARELDRAMRSPGSGLKALDAGVGEARRGVEGLVGRIGPLGHGLSSLGAVGLAAAAGVAAAATGVAFALREARNAVVFAEELQDSADKINVGVEALQEWRAAALAVGLAAQDADAGLDGFQKKLGEALAGGRSVKWFERLGFSREDLQAFDDTEAALDAVMDKISGLGTEAERAAVSEKLGLGPLIPLVRQGSEEVARLRQEARDMGIVMDREMVQRADEAGRQMEILSQVIDMQLKQAFVGLAPVIVQILGLVAQLAKALNDAFADFQRLEDKANRRLIEEDAELAARERRMVEVDGPYERMGPATRAAYDRLGVRRGQISRELASRQAGAAPSPPRADTALVDVAGGGRAGGGGGPNRTLQEGQSALERLESLELTAKRDHLREFEGFADTAESRALVARGLLDLEIQQRDAELAEMQAAIEKAGLMTDEVKGRFERQALLNAEIDAARRAAIDAEEAEALSRRRLQAEDAWLRVQTDILGLASASARTTEERRRIELDLLAIAQRRRRAELEAAIAVETDAQARQRLVMALADLGKVEAAETREVERRNGNPIEQWFGAQPQSWGEFKELMQGETLNALDDLNRGLIDAVRNAESFGEAMANMGDVAVNALMRVVEALLEVWLQKQIIEPFVSGIWGRDGNGGAIGRGTDVWNIVRTVGAGMFSTRAKGGGIGASGLTLVGEYGPEMLHLPVGAHVDDAIRTARFLRQPLPGADMRTGFAGGGQAQPVALSVRVINQTSEPVAARVVQTPDGLDAFIQPAVEQAVRRMGATGALDSAHRLTPGLRRR